MRENAILSNSVDYNIDGYTQQKIYDYLHGSLPSEGLFDQKAWRFSPKPWLLPPRWIRELERIGYRLHQWSQAAELLYRHSLQGKQPAWIAQLLEQGKPADLVALGRDSLLSGQTPEVLRPDLLWQGDGFKLCELDQIPGGIGLTAWLQECYAALQYQIVGGKDGMVAGFASILPKGDIIVSQEASMYRPEMSYLIQRLQVWGEVFRGQAKQEQYDRNPHHAFVEQEARWRLLDEFDRGPWQQKVYRFFELFDLENIPIASQLWDAMRAQKVEVTPPPKPILEEKLWMGLFWMPSLRDFWIRHLSARGVEQLQQCIPYTWILNPEILPPQAVYPRLEIHSWEELKRFSQKKRDLVLKISGFDPRGWGSRGVTIGSDVSQERWAQAIDQALEEYPHHPYILQVFEHTSLVEHPYFIETAKGVEVLPMSGRVRLTPYYFLPHQGEVQKNHQQSKRPPLQLSGALATICPADKKLLHGMSEAILVPLGVAAE